MGFPEFEQWWDIKKPNKPWAERFDIWYDKNVPKEEPTESPPPSSNQTWIYPWRSDSLWSKPLPTNPEIYSDSASKVSAFITEGKLSGAGIIAHDYGAAIVTLKGGEPTYTVRSTTGWPTNIHRYGAVPIPLGAKASLGTDGHLCIFDPVTHRFWNLLDAKFDGSGWSMTCGDAGTTDDYSGITPSNYAAATAANMPLLGGLIRPEEIRDGVIKHRMTFCTPTRQDRHYYPATHHGGSGTGPISEGSLIQLDPSVNVDALAISSWKKTILKALQKYGAYHRDGGGHTMFYGEDDINRTSGQLRWSDVGLGNTYNSFGSGVPWNRLRVLTANQVNH